MTSKEKWATIVVCMIMIFILSNPLHGININYAFLLLVPIMFIPGVDVANTRVLRTLKWDTLFFAVSCISVGTVGAALGVHTLISNIVTPLLSDLGPKTASFGVLILVTLLNFILTPTAMFSALPGILAEMAIALGFDPQIFIYQLINGADMIFLSYEFIPYLIFASFGMISFNEFLKFSTVKVLIFFVFVWVLLFPWWSIIGLL